MPLAIRFFQHGGPEVLRTEEFDPGRPAPGEAQVRQSAIGVNYIDVYDRTGLYPVTLPSRGSGARPPASSPRSAAACAVCASVNAWPTCTTCRARIASCAT